MADLRKLTVRALRDLARKHLGRGYTRLKTRSELVAALADVLPGKLRGVLEAAPRGEGPAPAPAKGRKPPPREQGKRPGPRSPRQEKPERRAVPGPRSNGRASAPPALAAPASASSAGPGSKPGAEPAPAAAAAARVNLGAVRPSLPLSELDERLGELPETYGEDTVVLLPKDPHCLYLYWDFSPATIERAFAWMPGGRAKLRLFDGERVLREIDVTLDARCWYLHGLTANHVYRAELIARAEDGQVRRIGPSSNSMRLPPVGPSRTIDDRFVRVPFDLPAGQLAELLKQSLAARWRRVPGAAGPVPSPLIRFVEPPPFPEETRALLHQASGGGAGGAPSSSESQPAASESGPDEPRDEGGLPAPDADRT